MVIDDGIAMMVREIEKYYGDKATAYIVTSDHGMTNWGEPHITIVTSKQRTLKNVLF